MKLPQEKLRYDTFSIRLSKETKEKLILKRKETGLSWNKFIVQLLKHGTL